MEVTRLTLKERKNQEKYPRNDLLLLARVAIKIRITTPRAAREGMNMFHCAYQMLKMYCPGRVNRKALGLQKPWQILSSAV